MSNERIDLASLADLIDQAKGAKEMTVPVDVDCLERLIVSAERDAIMSNNVKGMGRQIEALLIDARESLMRRVDLAMEAARMRAERDVAHAALARVEALHRRRPWHWSDGNDSHGDHRCQDCNVNWPCDTIRALNGEVAE